MCRIDGCDRADWSSTDYPLARKAHKCSECRREILPGERYMKVKTGMEGYVSVDTVCSHCEVLVEWLAVNCGGSLLGEVIEEIEEHAQEYDRADLSILANWARAKWRTVAPSAAGYFGMPLPPVPAALTLKPT